MAEQPQARDRGLRGGTRRRGPQDGRAERARALQLPSHLISIWYGDGPAGPRLAPRDALAAAGLDAAAEHEVTLGWTIERHGWIDDPTFRARTVLAGYALSPAVNEGRVTALPVRLSAVAALIASDPPDLAVVSGRRRDGRLIFADAVSWADVLARTAARVVVEITEDGLDLDAPEIRGNVVATVARADRSDTTAAAASRPGDEIDLTIGALVTSLLPDEPTVQFGPGGIGEGIARALDRPVRVLSGLVTDAMAAIHGRGLLLAPVTAAYAWGGDPIRALAADGMLTLASATVTHDLTRLSATPRFVGCNTALQVGLGGDVNVERIGRRTIAAVGGHSDFCVGASRSVGGLSVIAVRSTTANGASTIVGRVDAVSTQRSDIDVVVTEHGIADLRGVSDSVRAERLIGIAAPEHRAALASTPLSVGSTTP